MNENINRILEELKKTLNNKKILLACSTGVDSMVLFDLLEKSISSDKIVIAHVNHQKRKQSIEEESFIKDYCKMHNIKCYITKLPHYDGNSFQSWARYKRYEFFLEVAKLENIDMILLAHHANDNIETILQRILRSSSLEGYAGIRKYSKFKEVDIYRPLLDLSKNDIINYAKCENIKYFNDASNDEDDYTRNRIRHHIIPFLEKENPSLVSAINNFSNTIFEANDFIENYETNFIKRQEIAYNNNEYYAKIKLDEFLAETDFMKVQILFRILKPFSLSKGCIIDTIKQISSSSKRIIKDINQDLLMVKEYGYVIFTTKKEKFTYYLKIESNGTYDLPNNRKLEVNKNICNFITSNGKLWYNVNILPLIIRTRKNGDKIKTKYGTVKVSDYLTNKKVPYLEREETLLLCNNEDKPIAILGYILI